MSFSPRPAPTHLRTASGGAPDNAESVIHFDAMPSLASDSMKFCTAQAHAAWSSKPSFSVSLCSDAQRHDEPLGHGLRGLALVFVEAAQLGLRLGAAGGSRSAMWWLRRLGSGSAP